MRKTRADDISAGLPGDLEHRLLLTLEFHRWGSAAEGVADGRTIYAGTFADPRSDARRLQELCDRVARYLGAGLPGEAGTMLLAGRLYRRSADYVKACEYFLKALECVHRRQGRESAPCA